MKLYLRTIICVIGLIISGLLLATCFKTDAPLLDKVAEILGITGSNVLTNSDFKDDLNGWKYDENISVIDTNGIRQVYIKGNNRNQTRIWQEINVTSGQTYKLTFTLNGPSTGGFAIFKNDKNGEEQYLWCNDKNENKHYKMVVNPTTTGSHRVFLSTCVRGDYFYSNVKFKKNNEIVRFIFIGVSILIVWLFSQFNGTLFVLILFLSFIPVIKINKETKSIAENRALAEYRPFIDNLNKINVNYCSDFNNWINDHFWLRNNLISLNTDIKFLLDRKHENKFAFQCDEGWLFSKHDYNDQSYIETCKKIKDNIDNTTKYYSQKGIKIYFAIMPEKECQYSEKHYLRKFDKEKIPEYLSLICTNNYVYLKEYIEKYKKDGCTHFKEDHHWTHLGAFGGYQGIMHLIKKDFDVSILGMEDFIIKDFYGVYDNQSRVRPFQNNKKMGSTYNQLNLDDKLYKYVNKYLIFIPKVMPRQTKTEDIYATYSGGENTYKIMIIGDSNIGYILPFITSSFSDSLFLPAAGRSKYPDNWSIKSYDSIILNFKPQIIVVLIRAVNASNWLNLF